MDNIMMVQTIAICVTLNADTVQDNQFARLANLYFALQNAMCSCPSGYYEISGSCYRNTRLVSA